jgi:hypothetical protein
MKPDLGKHINAMLLVAAVASFCIARPVSAQSSGPPGTTSSAAAVPIPDDLPKRPFRRLTEGPVTLNPGSGQDAFPYVDMYDSALAAPEVHHIRYMNEHVRFIEVAYFPGVRARMHGHAYSSVFAIDAPVPKAVNLRLDPERPNLIGHGGGPKGQEFPRCQTMGPQAPHAETNLDTWPHHFYRLEFLRVDGDGLAQHWREWYPRLTDPLLSLGSPKPAPDKPLTTTWRYAQAYDSVLAAPNNYRLLYEDEHVRLVEVSIRPGETEPMHGDPYPSVLAFDNPPPQKLPVRYLDRASPQNSQDRTEGVPPPGLTLPGCATLGPQAPHALTNTTDSLIHYYRIEFKRIDGEALRTRWAEWYPWMAEYKRAWDVSPYTLNY